MITRITYRGVELDVCTDEKTRRVKYIEVPDCTTDIKPLLESQMEQIENHVWREHAGLGPDGQMTARTAREFTDWSKTV